MTRHEFTCIAPGCGCVLAPLSPQGLFQLQPGAVMLFNPSYRTLRLRCACGAVACYGRQRKIEALVAGGAWEGWAA